MNNDGYMQLGARVAALEAAVADLQAQLVAAGLADAPADTYVTTGPAWEDDVRALLAEGRTIEAIKLVREVTGWGLKEAKDYVDHQQRPGY